MMGADKSNRGVTGRKRVWTTKLHKGTKGIHRGLLKLCSAARAGGKFKSRKIGRKQ